MIVAVIPARGGSKRLARKNLLMFGGEPLLGHSISLALSSQDVDRCLVSTEDAEIASVARSLGAEVVDRPADLADDCATSASVVMHAVQELEREGCRPEAVVTLQPNCPFRSVGLLNRGLDLFRSADAASLADVLARAIGATDAGVVDAIPFDEIAQRFRWDEIARKYLALFDPSAPGETCE